jgi:hypothetical protein
MKISRKLVEIGLIYLVFFVSRVTMCIAGLFYNLEGYTINFNIICNIPVVYFVNPSSLVRIS